VCAKQNSTCPCSHSRSLLHPVRLGGWARGAISCEREPTPRPARHNPSGREHGADSGNRKAGSSAPCREDCVKNLTASRSRQERNRAAVRPGKRNADTRGGHDLRQNRQASRYGYHVRRCTKMATPWRVRARGPLSGPDCTNFCTNFSSKPCETAHRSTIIAPVFSRTSIFGFAHLRLEIRLLTEGL
jgi:hypothetical protein